MKQQNKLSNINLDYLSSKINEKDFQLLRRTRELYSLKNKLERYQKRLLLEGFKFIKEYELHVNIYEVSDGYIDTTRIIELAQIKLPSLYRRYKSLEKKYFDRLNNLEILLGE